MNEIIIRGFDDPALNQDFLHVRSLALSNADKIREVKSLPMQELALQALTETQRLERGIEKTRKEVKEKPFQLCKKIDALAAEAVAPLEERSKKLKSLLGGYAEELRQEALALERQRQEEIRKAEALQREEEEKIALAAKAQADAIAEADRLRLVAENSNNAKARQAAERDRLVAQAKADAEAKKLEDAARAHQAKEDEIRASIPVVAPKATGASTKFILKYEVLDMNELFANYPHVCEITEKKSAVNMLINGLQMANPNDLPKVKGLRVWKEADVNTRSK